jgi:hypothetical protein
MNLELTLSELNDLYYVVSKGVESHKELVEIAKRTTPELEKYFDKELSKSIQLLDKIQTALHSEYQVMDDEPEYDSAGFTEDDRIVNGEYRTISNEDADEDAKQRDYSAFNNYADTIKQDEQRYSNKKLFTLNQNR